MFSCSRSFQEVLPACCFGDDTVGSRVTRARSQRSLEAQSTCLTPDEEFLNVEETARHHHQLHQQQTSLLRRRLGTLLSRCVRRLVREVGTSGLVVAAALSVRCCSDLVSDNYAKVPLEDSSGENRHQTKRCAAGEDVGALPWTASSN